MALYVKRLLYGLDQRVRKLGFDKLENLAYWIDMGVDVKTILRWRQQKINPGPLAVEAIEGLLAQIESDPHHYMRNFAGKKRLRECCAS